MLNLKYYKGSDLYSDGSTEDELLDIFKNNKNIDDILASDYRWPIVYHLSPNRKNLLQWYPFEKNESLLELGAGCGAITELLCQKLGSVTAIELSKKRSEINMYRNKDAKNLEIMVGNLNDIEIDNKFDYVTLIGVLEYTRSFINKDNPYKVLFEKIKKWLKPNGKLIIAIENKFGIKYWTGAKEDHTGRSFDGLEGYVHNESFRKVETFTKQELTKLINENGFSQITYYYPFPDYKMPEIIYSDKYLPNNFTELTTIPYFDAQGYKVFNEVNVLTSIVKSNLYDIFANSFLCIVERNHE